MGQVLCSTGALIGRPNGRDWRLLGPLAQRLDCDGFEVMVYATWYDQMEDMLRDVQGFGLNIPVVHCEKKVGEHISLGHEEAFRLYEINCRAAQRLGAQKLVLHLWDGVTSDAFIHRNLAAYPRLRDVAQAHGLDLLVENVVCNVQDPMLHWRQLREEYSDVHLVFDTKMAAFHGQVALLDQPEYAWLWQDGHIRHYHLNDYAGGYMDWKNLRTLPIGQGNVDFQRVFAHIRATGYRGTFTVESTAFDQNGAVDTDVLNAQFQLIRDNTDA